MSTLAAITPTSKIAPNGQRVYRVIATYDAPHMGVSAGDLGGWAYSTSALRQNAWVADEAMVLDQAVLRESARLEGHAIASGRADIGGYSLVGGESHVGDDALVRGDTTLNGSVDVTGHARLFNEHLNGHLRAA